MGSVDDSRLRRHAQPEMRSLARRRAASAGSCAPAIAARWSSAIWRARPAGIVDADELEVEVVTRRRVEVDEAHAENALDQALVGLDVLQALVRRRMVGAREDAVADVDALVRDDVVRVDALEPAADERDQDEDHRHQPEPPDVPVDAREAVDQLRRHADGEGDQHPLDVEGEHRPPRRPSAPDDLFSVQQFHASDPTSAARRRSQLSAGDRALERARGQRHRDRSHDQRGQQRAADRAASPSGSTSARGRPGSGS